MLGGFLATFFIIMTVGATNFCPDFCPPRVTPTFTLISAGTARSTNTSVCCPATYANCTASEPFCRDLVEYTLRASGDGEAECPPTIPDCECQISVNGRMNLTFCPKPQECCPTCSCVGDPHCNSFNRSIPEADLVVCDARNENCVNAASTCRLSMWDGKNCTWDTRPKTPYCARAPGTTQPFLKFYSKFYTPPGGGPKVEMSINLTIEAYGSIHVIDIVDNGFRLQYSVGTTRCTSPPAPYNLRQQGTTGNFVVQFTLPSSQVEIEILCFPNEAAFARLDIDIRDPTLQLALRNDDFVPTGYCVTGKIPQQALAFNAGNCLGINRELGTNIWRVCRQSQPLPTCYTNWCSQSKYWSRLEINGVISQSSCNNYLNNDINGWIYSSCAISPIVANGRQIVTPQDCPNDPTCAKCVSDCLDFPQLCRSILFAPRPTPPAICTSPTNGLLQTGLRRKSLASNQRGIEIQYSMNGITWTPIFALLNTETQSCPCDPLTALATDPLASVLFKYGEYRVIQCTQQGGKPCDGSPGYQVQIDYFNPGSNSVPFETLYSMNKLACTPEQFPNCPPNYQCCMWTSRSAWSECMIGSGENPADYPKCF